MRIAYVGNPGTVHIQRWVREFTRRGHDCQLFTPADVETGDTDAVPFGMPGQAGLAAAVVRGLDLRAHLRRFRPHVLHAHFALGYGTWAALSGFRPLVVTCMGTDLLVAPSESWWNRLKVQLALCRADLVTVNAGHLGSAAVRLGASNARVVRVVQGVFPHIYRPAPRPRQAGAPVILSTRHLHPVYRIADLVSAAARLARQGLAFQLHLAGRGSTEPALRAQVRRLGLDDRVTFLGYLEGEAALAAAYQRADIYASVSESDGASVALLEAMACGLPVVATDIPASREWLTLGSGNPLVRVGDNADIASGLAHLLKHPGLGVRAGERNRRMVLRSANWPLEMDRMEAHYRRLADV